MQKPKRKSHTPPGKIYFWTASINTWYPLFENDTLKEIIISSLRTLSERKLITVYAFVIMPTHVHFIWKFWDLVREDANQGDANQENPDQGGADRRGTNEMSATQAALNNTGASELLTQKLKRRESAKGSFMKFTAHQFQKFLIVNGGLEKYKVNAANKAYEFWQRDSLGIEILSRKVASQKLAYVHNNPVAKKWKLAKNYVSYYYSSARFYEFGIDEFGFLVNFFDEFDKEALVL